MLGVHSYTFKSLREAVKFSAAVAALFLIAALCCLHWAYSRGAFGAAPVEHPVNLKAGSSINVHFSVPNRGDHRIMIWYSRDASDDVSKNLDGIVGKATLRIGEDLVAQFPLPVYNHSCDGDGCAMVLFIGPTEPRNDYSLLLQVDRIPQSLAESQAAVKVELVSDYYLLFLELELVAALLLLAALSCAFLSARWWRAAARAGGDQNDDVVDSKTEGVRVKSNGRVAQIPPPSI